MQSQVLRNNFLGIIILAHSSLCAMETGSLYMEEWEEGEGKEEKGSRESTRTQFTSFSDANFTPVERHKGSLAFYREDIDVEAGKGKEYENLSRRDHRGSYVYGTIDVKKGEKKGKKRSAPKIQIALPSLDGGEEAQLVRSVQDYSKNIESRKAKFLDHHIQTELQKASVWRLKRGLGADVTPVCVGGGAEFELAVALSEAKLKKRQIKPFSGEQSFLDYILMLAVDPETIENHGGVTYLARFYKPSDALVEQIWAAKIKKSAPRFAAEAYTNNEYKSKLIEYLYSFMGTVSYRHQNSNRFRSWWVDMDFLKNALIHRSPVNADEVEQMLKSYVADTKQSIIGLRKCLMPENNGSTMLPDGQDDLYLKARKCFLIHLAEKLKEKNSKAFACFKKKYKRGWLLPLCCFGLVLAGGTVYGLSYIPDMVPDDNLIMRSAGFLGGFGGSLGMCAVGARSCIRCIWPDNSGVSQVSEKDYEMYEEIRKIWEYLDGYAAREVDMNELFPISSDIFAYSPRDFATVPVSPGPTHSDDQEGFSEASSSSSGSDDDSGEKGDTSPDHTISL